MSDIKAPPPRDSLPDPDSDTPQDVGMAEMDKDGTLRLYLRTEETDGTIGEMMMTVVPQDPKYAGMVAHLSGIKPGQAKAIPPFPEPVIDPDSV
jgi:hypothetical protein